MVRMRLELPSDTDVVPDVLAHFRMQYVQYSDLTNFDNYFGRMANRILPEDWQPRTEITFDHPVIDGSTAMEGSVDPAQEISVEEADEDDAVGTTETPVESR